MTFDSWLILLLACCGACVIPGPNSLIVLSHSARFGVPKTIWTMAGGMLGFMFLMTITVLGLGAVMTSYPWVLDILKNIGSLYLALIGLRLWWSIENDMEYQVDHFQGFSVYKLFLEGLISAITNVNALFFFISIIPNIINNDHNIFLQAVECSLTLGICEFCFEFLFALATVYFAKKILKPGKVFNRICGSIFFGFAVLLQFKQY
ncbi:LysE family translocator [Pantoea sp. Al-1710]|uniref:LysE family translocator n=1 Tax=Candidatus Pantoea communis TaxID=2608354 RepID=A0ABX0RL97_9GAMM|nr:MULTISPECIES: LysE family translocator [Pantoea]NIG12903.1 LysE family translocator [Pantoea sp. Cy-640]NIG17396.1 LysE family translocator [Pantoea communis]